MINQILRKIEIFFEFAKHKTNFKFEILAGISTFMALSYIFVVNPAILSNGGFNPSAVLFATILTAFLGTFIMGVWAKKPFVLAPGMEMNAYIAFFVISALGFTWQQSLGAVFWSGIIFVILTITNIRQKVINAIPDKMKSGLSLSVGVFLMLIALRLAGVLLYEGVTISGIGLFFSPLAYVLYIGLVLMLVLRKLKVPGAILLSIILASIFAYLIGITNTGTSLTISSEMFEALFQLDLKVILDPRMWGVILTLFLIDFYGSVAKFIGLTRSTTIVDKNGNLPRMKETLLVDGASTVVGSALGTTNITVYVESGVGIAEGGRTGLTAVVCSLFMLLFIALAPLISLVPVIATTGALFWVGILLMPTKEELKDYRLLEIITVLAMVIATIWTFAIDRALLIGFIIFIIGAIITKQFKEIHRYMIISTILLLIGFVYSLIIS